MVRISVLYPNEPGKKFDHDYYINKHMKLVRARLTAFGVLRNIQPQMQISEIIG